MPIANDKELKAAANQASKLIQDIHNYCKDRNKTLADFPESKVKFPRGFIRTAAFQRGRFPFLRDYALKSNIAYTLILSDTILWLSLRTDVSGIARDMLNKLFIFLVGSIIESVTKVYLRAVCGKNFGARLDFLVDNNVIAASLRDELCWICRKKGTDLFFESIINSKIRRIQGSQRIDR